MKDTLTELINELEDLNKTDAIGHSSYKKLMSLVRLLQTEGGK